MTKDLEYENSYDVHNGVYEKNNNTWEDESGWGSCEKYGGYNDFDDFTIDVAFDGDPKATWNVV